MNYLPSDLIRKKRFGQTHTHEEIRFFVRGYSDNRIPDYQIAAWLMAICFRGMNAAEITWLTQEMRDSGVVLNLKHLGMTVDKHSTGGVGDKVSLILAPLVAAAGVRVPMIAGRGLGHTGGTLDKLESLPGFSVNLNLDQFERQLASVGVAIMGQTLEICPADRKLYALRDVTGTIDCLPLICGSIMSKKLAGGAAALVLDVKFGSGAFMKDAADAEILARALIEIGNRAGTKMTALLTRMDEPLGRFVGNALEVRECLDILEGKVAQGVGKSYDDTRELTLELAGHMICLGGKAATPALGKILAADLLKNGSALKKFKELCLAQGARATSPPPESSVTLAVTADQAGYMKYVDVEKIGSTSILLGAGRKFQTDILDIHAGLEVFRRQGEKLQEGDPLFTLFAQTPALLAEALPTLKESFTISPQPVPQSPLIAKVMI